MCVVMCVGVLGCVHFGAFVGEAARGTAGVFFLRFFLNKILKTGGGRRFGYRDFFPGFFQKGEKFIFPTEGKDLGACV